MADLITLAEAKLFLGVTGTAEDARITELIEGVTAVIQNYTGRNFADNPASSTKTFIYDGSGFLEIDDCTAVSAVTMDGATLTTDEFIAQPFNGPVYTWLDLSPFYSQSWEMGFTRNLDTPFGRRRLINRSVQVQVTADWGWPDVPKDIKQAALWTLNDWHDNPDDLISESIAAYSKMRAAKPIGGSGVIPERALKILDLYIRISM